MIIGKHISNILTFVYLEKHSESVEGQIFLSTDLYIKITQYQMSIVLLPLILIAIFTGSWFAWGGVASLIMGLLKIQMVLQKVNRSKNRRGISS